MEKCEIGDKLGGTPRGNSSGKGGSDVRRCASTSTDACGIGRQHSPPLAFTRTDGRPAVPGAQPGAQPTAARAGTKLQPAWRLFLRYSRVISSSAPGGGSTALRFITRHKAGPPFFTATAAVTRVCSLNIPVSLLWHPPNHF